MKIDLNYFPGWVRKSMTFTIDDGNLVLDRKFMDYVKPAGIKGTFNLRTPLNADTDTYKKLYKGYEIANHCRYHAYPFTTDRPVQLKDEPFDRETADPSYVYNAGEEGLYRIHTYAWCFLADDRKYMECVDSCKKDLEEIFGEGSIKGYIWPCGEQKNEKVFEMLKGRGYQNIRITGCVKDSTGFALPADRMRWSYNADYTCLNETAKKYDAYPDDGELKFFCFGVHSHDFENNSKWDELISFCRDYGCRPQDFWYAGVSEIMDYEDAVKQVIITDNTISNPTDTDLYITVGGVRKVLEAGETLALQ